MGKLLMALLLVLGSAPVAASQSNVPTLDFSREGSPTQGTLTSGEVSVSVDHRKQVDNTLSFWVPEIEVFVGGKSVFKATGSESPIRSTLVQIAEMDAENPHPEVIFSSFTGGAHCCNEVQIATSTPGWLSMEKGRAGLL